LGGETFSTAVRGRVFETEYRDSNARGRITAVCSTAARSTGPQGAETKKKTQHCEPDHAIRTALLHVDVYSAFVSENCVRPSERSENPNMAGVCANCDQTFRHRSNRVGLSVSAADFQRCFGKQPGSNYVCRGACEQRVTLFAKYSLVFREVRHWIRLRPHETRSRSFHLPDLCRFVIRALRLRSFAVRMAAHCGRCALRWPQSRTLVVRRLLLPHLQRMRPLMAWLRWDRHLQQISWLHPCLVLTSLRWKPQSDRARRVWSCLSPAREPNASWDRRETCAELCLAPR